MVLLLLQTKKFIETYILDFDFTSTLEQYKVINSMQKHLLFIE